jgi:hypothetical protein
MRSRKAELMNVFTSFIRSKKYRNEKRKIRREGLDVISSFREKMKKTKRYNQSDNEIFNLKVIKEGNKKNLYLKPRGFTLNSLSKACDNLESKKNKFIFFLTSALLSTRKSVLTKFFSKPFRLFKDSFGKNSRKLENKL